MPSITDASGNPLTQIALVIGEASESAVIVCRVPCRSGTYLTAEGQPMATVFARRTGSGQAFAALSLAPISLTDFNDQTIEFDVKIVTGEVSGLESMALPVRVTHQP